ncbi:alpha/beta fold hydrolase [candidate division KSB3 bacterium]|uniref:Alpha/beta fold hydrolase n=1 Tax=candidate division KSB3 bacterium TaxID=2044937 RepID=A0A9D5JUN5_9BACT|nr:alpha/beta fold hydrolase [candidate division KSB3 bacterium]MBD3323996.1 alpha/beta fold hydrolase [candidate division KSB3 bacterium]
MPYFTHQTYRLFYREQGDGPLLILLPGNTASSACHEDELVYFSRHYHAVALDFLGTGRSDRLDAWPDDWWERAAADVAALVQFIGEDRAVLMGTSGGGIVALLTAILFPERVQAVVADSCVERYPADMLREVVAERQERSERQVAFWQFAHGEDWQQVVEADSDLLLRAAQHGDLDWAQGRLTAIRCPVLLTASLRDNSLPDVANQMCRMAAQIPDSRLFLVNGGAHPLMWSRREDFLCVSEYFLKAS